MASLDIPHTFLMYSICKSILKLILNLTLENMNVRVELYCNL